MHLTIPDFWIVMIVHVMYQCFFSLLFPQPEWWRTCKIELELGTCRSLLFLSVLGVGKKINCYLFVWKWFVNDNVERPPNSFFYICFLSHKKMSVCSLDSFCPSIWLDSLESIVLCCKKNLIECLTSSGWHVNNDNGRNGQASRQSYVGLGVGV